MILTRTVLHFFEREPTSQNLGPVESYDMIEIKNTNPQTEMTRELSIDNCGWLIKTFKLKQIYQR